MYMRNLIATVFFLTIAAPVMAAPLLVIDSVLGVWTDGVTTPSGQPSGLGTNKISWGIPDTVAGPSSYTFGAFPVITSPGPNLFSLGKFLHANNPIYDPSLVSATLNVTLNGHVGSNLFTTNLEFLFNHNETLNTGPGCCDDIVNVNRTANQSFAFDGVLFTLSGYLATLTGTTPVTDFLTVESGITPGRLLAEYTSTPIATPIPGALPLFASALVGLGLLARRRRKQNV